MPNRAPALDHAVLQQVLAWQSGEVVFDDTPLPEAVQEVNRYSERQILLEGPAMDSLRIGGLFQAGDSEAFARAIAETFDIGMRQDGNKIFLYGRTASPQYPRH